MVDSSDPHGRHLPTPTVRILEGRGREVPERELGCVFVFVRRKAPGRRVVLEHYRTDNCGRICRWTTRSERADYIRAIRRTGHGPYVPFETSGTHRVFACAEVQFGGQGLVDAEMRDVTLTGPERFRNKVGNEEERRFLDWTVTTPSFASMETTHRSWVEGATQGPDLGRQSGDGVTDAELDRYRRLLKDWFPANYSVCLTLWEEVAVAGGPPQDPFERVDAPARLLDVGSHTGPGWRARVGGESVGLQKAYGLDRAWPEVCHENLYVNAGSLSMRSAMGVPDQGLTEGRKVTDRVEVWQLAKSVDVHPSVKYPAADHAALADALRRRFAAYVSRISVDPRFGGAGTVAAAAALQEFPADRSSALGDALVAPAPPAAANTVGPPAPDAVSALGAAARNSLRSCLCVGRSTRSFDGAFADALRHASPEFKCHSVEIDLVAQGSATEAARKGYFELPIAHVFLQCATAHSDYDFNLSTLSARVDSWWSTVPAEVRQRLILGAIRVDGYSSQVGSRAVDPATGRSVNQQLADERRENVVQALLSLPRRDLFRVEFTGAAYDTSRAPGPSAECLASVALYDPASAYGRWLPTTEGTDNSWQHRGVAITLLQRVRIPPCAPGHESQAIRSDLATRGSYPVRAASVLAVAASRRTGAAEDVRHALVLVTPGKISPPA